MFRSIEGVFKANRGLYSVSLEDQLKPSTRWQRLPFTPEIEGNRDQSFVAEGTWRLADALGMFPSLAI